MTEHTDADAEYLRACTNWLWLPAVDKARLRTIAARLEALQAENAINADDALRALRFDLEVGQAYPDVVDYCNKRIAAIEASDAPATLAAREALWHANYNKLKARAEALQGAGEAALARIESDIEVHTDQYRSVVSEGNQLRAALAMKGKQ